MELKDFEFDLPEERIAQHPLSERDSSRLMVLSRSTGAVTHSVFRRVGEYLSEGDLLVVNDTKVMPARLLGTKSTGGKIEVLLVEELSDGSKELWRCLIKNSKGLKAGSLIHFDGGEKARAVSPENDGFWRVEFEEGFSERLDGVGRIPLPPYIRREAVEEDRERYQTVFAGKTGAVAAPTAGLHFTEGLLEGIKKKGVEVLRITLHTGPGTFMPVRAEKIEEHRMYPERYTISPEVYGALLKAKADKRRVVAVGTTSTRALEAAVVNGFEAPVLSGSTELFIYPGFRFRVVDSLLTNFHLPGSTLIMLVAAFAGREQVLTAYKEAVKMDYRFFSYGDAMLVI
ncbi:MAG: tRNA preQ1(34) S-adenosylmethionine ribosyltransferase-isomerase QueA [Deltaproteobacteria bacterium]|nr:tRNA preQ1(34) S-adenosylmethionine ribosyltransferase-isomerase QueA [Deltaproteobacteria bacterium]